MVDEQEARQRIALWWLYGLVGNPQEQDYGDDMPDGIGPAGLESQYKSPQTWHREEPRLTATREDYDLVEPIYRKRSVRDRMTIAFYAGHPKRAVRRADAETWNQFFWEVRNV